MAKREDEKRDPLIALRIPPDLDQRLRADVEARGTTITEVVRSLIADQYPRNGKPTSFVSPNKIERKRGYQPVTNQPPPTRAPTKPPRPRVDNCEHRVRSGSYCKRCDRII